MSKSYKLKSYLFKALKVSSILAVSLLCLLPATAEYSWGFELKVKNSTTVDIYPTVLSGESKEKFGVVPKGKSKTVGFSPFSLGEVVQVSWKVGNSYDLSNVFIDTAYLKKIPSKIKSVHLIYYGKDIWILKAFDEDMNDVGSVHSKAPNPYKASGCQ